MIQNLQELRQGGIAVTIAKYETPLHNNINKVSLCCVVMCYVVIGSDSIWLDCMEYLTLKSHLLKCVYFSNYHHNPNWNSKSIACHQCDIECFHSDGIIEFLLFFNSFFCPHLFYSKSVNFFLSIFFFISLQSTQSKSLHSILIISFFFSIFRLDWNYCRYTDRMWGDSSHRDLCCKIPLRTINPMK